MNFRLFGIIFLTVTLLLSSDAYAFSLTGFFSSLFKEPAPPTILDTYVSPVKVYPGQTLRVLVEVDDAFGIKEAYADFHHELGSDKVNLIPTFEKNGKYALQASWVVHDTKNLAWYDIGVTVVNNKDLSATATVKYQDPTVSHPASQIEAGTFPAGNFTFSNDVKIMGVLSGGSPLKISGGINLTDVPGSTPTNTQAELVLYLFDQPYCSSNLDNTDIEYLSGPVLLPFQNLLRHQYNCRFYNKNILN